MRASILLLFFCLAFCPLFGCASVQSEIATGATITSGLGETSIVLFNEICENIAKDCPTLAAGEEHECKKWAKCDNARRQFLEVYDIAMTAFETAAALAAADRETEAEAWYIKAVAYLDKLKKIAVEHGFIDNLFQLVKRE